MKYFLKCVSCGKEYDSNPMASTCPICGSFKGTLDVLYPYDKLKITFKEGLSGLANDSIVNSFLSILPFDKIKDLPPVPVGETPIFKSPNLSSLLGIDSLFLKDDTRNPSASLKDRASAVAIAMAKQAGISTIAAASTGNAASSLATLTASTSAKAVLFVPKTIPKPKLAQLLIHSADVFLLDCDYDKAFELCQTSCDKFGWYNRNTAVNPFTGEGKKTVALEIARDIGKAPDVIICPVGDGCIISGIYKGFFDLMNLGLIEGMPRLYGIQAEGASPLVKAFNDNTDIQPLSNVNTIADSISVGYPRDGVKALRAVTKTDGAMISVKDDEILDAQKLLASKAGIFTEPAASAAIAGLIKLKDKKYIQPDETIVTILTGHGLKDVETAMNNINIDVEIVKPDVNCIADKINEKK